MVRGVCGSNEWMRKKCLMFVQYKLCTIHQISPCSASAVFYHCNKLISMSWRWCAVSFCKYMKICWVVFGLRFGSAGDQNGNILKVSKRSFILLELIIKWFSLAMKSLSHNIKVFNPTCKEYYLIPTLHKNFPQ
jgi:hypothetical protein